MLQVDKLVTLRLIYQSIRVTIHLKDIGKLTDYTKSLNDR